MSNIILPGTGSTVATEQIAGADYQLVKLVTGTPGSTTPLTTIPISNTADGTDITTPVPAMPAGGAGIRGWLSAIWTRLNDATAIQIIQPQTLTKGTQGANGLTTQDLKDAGRTSVILTVDEYQTAFVADTMINTMASSKANAAPTTGLSSYAVTAGKTFRAQFLSLQVSVTTGNTTAIKVYVRMRALPGGAAIVSSPVVYEAIFASSGTAFGSSTPFLLPLPDGLEFAALTGIGFSAAAPGFSSPTAAPLVTAVLIGYEY